MARLIQVEATKLTADEAGAFTVFLTHGADKWRKTYFPKDDAEGELTRLGILNVEHPTIDIDEVENSGFTKQIS